MKFSRKPDRRLAALLATTFLLVVFLSCSDRSPTRPDIRSPAESTTAGSTEAGSAIGRHPGSRVVNPRNGPATLLEGNWGGEHVGVTIAGRGAAVEYDCAGGSIDEPFRIDSAGRFDLAGAWWFTPPVLPIGWVPDRRPARYAGVVSGSSMTLTVTHLDTNEVVGRFSLARDALARIIRCL